MGDVFIALVYNLLPSTKNLFFIHSMFITLEVLTVAVLKNVTFLADRFVSLSQAFTIYVWHVSYNTIMLCCQMSGYSPLQ